MRAWHTVDVTEADSLHSVADGIGPVPTETAMMQRVLAGLGGERRLELPQQRMATAEEVAAVIGFLVDPGSSFVSGAVVPADGAATSNTAACFPAPAYSV